MSFSMREARADDVSVISEWTTDTFACGDYVPARLQTWIDDPDSVVLVCEEEGTSVAVVHALMLSEQEGWLEAARVHPDHRRSGMGSALNQAGVSWARDRNAKVVRLAIEAGNAAARNQITGLGYRETSSWIHARFEIEQTHRADESTSLRPGTNIDADAAWMFWSGTDLAFAGRGLLAHGWQWRKATANDLHQAASEGQFFQSAAGWVIGVLPQPDHLQVGWMALSPSQAPELLVGLKNLGARLAVRELSIKIPNLPWTAEALNRAAGTNTEVLIYSLFL